MFAPKGFQFYRNYGILPAHMQLIRSFGKLGKNDAAIAGGKGASLGEMTRAGIPVPPGFVIVAGAFEQFLQETDLLQEIDAILHTVDHKEMHTVEHASEKIQALILAVPMPADIAAEIQKYFKELDAEFVAVRSSATAEDSASAAWAGQLDSYLNTTQAELLKNVQRCWASLFTPRAIFYRFEKELHLTKISVAVVVQKMVASEVSGIAFSVHPVTEDRNQLIIEAGFGLGEAIVSGQVTPDSYVVSKEPRKIIDVNVNTQTRALYRSISSRQAGVGGNEWQDIPKPKAYSQVLDEKQILELSEIILTIEKHYAFPCDIEWAFAEGKFYIVQGRPITTLNRSESNAETKGKRIIFEKKYERDTTFALQEFFSKCLLGDNYFHVGKGNPYTPLYIHYFDGVNIRFFENKLGMQWFSDQLLKKNLDSKEFVANIIADQREILPKLEEYWQKEILTEPELVEYLTLARRAMVNLTLYFFSGMDERTPEEIKNLIVEIRKVDELGANHDRFVRRTIASNGYPSEYADVLLADELMALPPREMLEARMKGVVLVDGTELFVGTLADYTKKHPELEFIGLQNKITLIKTLERDATLVAQGLFALAMTDGLEERFGFRIPYAPMELSYANKENLQLWENKKGLQWFLDRLLVENEKGPKFMQEVVDEYKPLYAKLEAFWHKGSITDKEELRDFLETTRVAMILMAACFYSGIDDRTPEAAKKLTVEMREGDNLYSKTDEFVRDCIATLGRKRDCAHVVLPYELLEPLPPDKELEKRTKGSLLFDGKDFVLGTTQEYAAKHSEYEFEGLVQNVGEITEVRGQVAQKGKVTGRVRLVKNRKQADELVPGEIMVSPMTTPDFIAGMQKAAAFVTDEGGIVCHAAIIAREMKKPCVIGTKSATQVFKDGDLVEVDAEKGIVMIIERA